MGHLRCVSYLPVKLASRRLFDTPEAPVFLVGYINAMDEKVWYRFESRLVAAGVDEWENPLGPPSVDLYCYEVEVIKHTPKGAWLRDLNDPRGKRFVLRGARRRWACPTLQEARESFIARKRRQINILRSQVHYAKEAKRMAEEGKGGEPMKAWYEVERI